MVRYRVAMTYRSFFLGAAFFAALFFAADFLAAADLLSALAVFFSALAVFFAAFFAAAFFAAGALAADVFFAAAFRPLTAGVEAGVARRGGSAIGASLIGGSVWPMAGALDQHHIRPEEVVRRHVAVRHDVHVRQVAAAQEHVRLHTVREHEHLLLADADARSPGRASPSCAARRS